MQGDLLIKRVWDQHSDLSWPGIIHPHSLLLCLGPSIRCLHRATAGQSLVCKSTTGPPPRARAASHPSTAAPSEIYRSTPTSGCSLYVQIHNWATTLRQGGVPSLEFAAPTKCYVVVGGHKMHLNLSKVPVGSRRTGRVLLLPPSVCIAQPLPARSSTCVPTRH